MKYYFLLINKLYIMWKIIIILTLVYWSLYKIIKEYSWSYFNKQEGFLLILNSTFFFSLIYKTLTLLDEPTHINTCLQK